uniref:Alpha/beta hydrolase domain-containing protein 13 n=1 Tax=Tanacetum cinerariifolium TaxID=118510 RepID=A0A6L2K5G3_TANCI|nr:alpha/beta hydrolase domain-containing protein 13 [Tanacetum cinerariifolium]
MPPRKDTSNDKQLTSFQDQVYALNAQLDALVNGLTNLLQARLETTLQKLTCQTTIIKNESNDSTSKTNTDITETTTEVINETTSPVTDINKHDNTMATCFFEVASCTIKPTQIISKDIINQNTSTTINISTTITKTDTKVITTYTPPMLPPITQREMVTFYSTNLHQTCAFSTIEDKLEAKRVWSSPSLLITLSFRCAKTFHPGHKCYPPKFVLLESEDDPPREPNDPRYKTMSLEDKACFKGGSIDTYLNVYRYHGLMNYLVKVIVLVFHTCLHFLMQVYNRPTTLGEAFSLARVTEARFKDERATTNIVMEACFADLGPASTNATLNLKPLISLILTLSGYQKKAYDSSTTPDITPEVATKVALEVALEAVRETKTATDTVAKIEETSEFYISESKEQGTKPEKGKSNGDGKNRRKKTPEGIKGLAECKASASNLRRIQVKEIIKEVEEYLKTYSSAGMNILLPFEEEQPELKLFSKPDLGGKLNNA